MDDSAVIRKVIEGDKNAYAELVHRYQAKVVRLCASLLRNQTDAEDAAQEVFVKAYQSLSRFQGNASFYTWLYRIASNHCLDTLRSRERHPQESWDSLLEKQGEKIEEYFTASSDMRRTLEVSDLVQQILGCLRPNYRLILTLREAEGLSYEEISRILDCSLDSVKAQLKRARQEVDEKLRHFLPPNGV